MTDATDLKLVHVPDETTLRRRGTMKWTVYPDDVLPAWVAESDFATCPVVHDAIRQAVDNEYFGYERRDGSPQRAFAEFQRERFGWDVDPKWVRLVPDVVKGVAVAIDELTPADSAIVITTPSYFPFFDVPRATKRPAIFVPMVRTAGSGAGGSGSEEWAFDYDALDSAFEQAGSMIVCNPYNPLGRAFRPEELQRLVELADRHGVRLISDEIHAPVVYSPATHTPTASISDVAAQVTVTVTATSKGWNTAGLHCAQMVFTNPEDRAVMDKVHPLRTGAASTLGQVSMMAAYVQGQEWLDEELAYLSGNLDLLEQRLPQALPGAQFERPEASFLLWVDLREVPGLAEKPAAKILERARVAFSEGTSFGDEGEGHVRINFATSRAILNEILDRLEAVSFTD
ncbi:MalY/PatB family protein [Corynebacterium auriscanis]|uniref:MalY/PatB family protein n=1 Tax=Corynebacterium auriscanis TaxID=99807 RepID=UPI002247CD2A|nr:aminotransferase class I/II-fold pyridoxal phosphate-dependent enzyme [Corynebacterium auriscanis]MCX2163383.1 aminotransferase class I/II-fold pyridoxal phosphate-dependent enzyme [Corynebacterium auriscanis]